MMKGQELFKEMSRHLLTDSRPSLYLGAIAEKGGLEEFPFSMFVRMKEAPQSPKHHPEGNVWNHTMLVVDEAAKVKNKSSDEKVFMWAALLHDIGKPGTTKTRGGRITAYNHEKLGAVLARQFLAGLSCDENFTDSVVVLIRWHMQILYVVKAMPFADSKSMKEEANIEDIALLGLCDRLGRGDADRAEEEKNVKMFLAKVKGQG
jgi:putative nucleotidyltransferase with HDIG domain